MNNQLSDLNDHLFAQLERLSVVGISDKVLKSELERTTGVISVSAQIIQNAKTTIDAANTFYRSGMIIPQLKQVERKKLA